MNKRISSMYILLVLNSNERYLRFFTNISLSLSDSR